MNWDAIGAIGEILGASAVFVTLVYLAVQVRHAKEQARLSVQQVRNSTFREIFLSVAQNPQITAVLAKAENTWTHDIETEKELFEKAEFTAEDQIVWANYYRAVWNYFREVIENRNDFDPAQLKSFERGLILVFEKSPSTTYFRGMEPINSPAIQFVKTVLEASRKAPLSNKSFEADA